ncbi:ATP-dependent DNA helicase RecG [Thiomicrorhabdus immobilis]|uniref:ATP-dependent DNA helicase RecG n=1 Tax=Thiomicrorhabdus immobilis TaxID=2791037 RepID=A0ABN6CZ76_9GAMM|nr:ATP-dependent DNA helicase RecG [Thiomicrorhabdus immobilis]BCN94426.1 ATP-dependent DNA helicase RecG [Thiomicrorhabdus immobilis]
MLSEHSLDNLKGVGPKQLEKLHKLGLFVVQDLLFHLPLRYQDKTKLTAIENAVVGSEVLIEGEIFSQSLTRGRRSSLLVKIQSTQGHFLTLRFFHFHYRQAQQFTRGKILRVFGEVRSGPNGLEMVHPSYQFISVEDNPALETTLTPIYPTTEGLGQASLLKLMQQAMNLLKQYPLKELLPTALLDELQLPDLNSALFTLHQPQPEDDLRNIKQFSHPAQQRLIVEELISQQAGLQLLRQTEQKRLAPALAHSQTANALLASLPFALTHAQQRVLQEIQYDLALPHPMQRLVQGDVGSGKTVIAALAAIQAAEAGFQVAVMAPTEILAEQHLNAFLEWLEPLQIPVAWLNGRLKAAEKRFQLAQIASGEAKVIIGTHALFQDAVVFNRLGLVVIDEQHRFGVHQRLALHEKGQNQDTHPHQLVMTATPIPRTLAMTAYGDLDISIIDELPPGRKPIDTAVLSNEKRSEVMEHLYLKCKQGIQAYWVCPLIEESELLHAQAAEVTATQFSDNWPDLRVGLVHGRLKGEQKALVMNAFKNHELDLLVATTVIEVGVNVPNSSLMIIENAERLGLAQLHQLRGRVGRGDLQSHCVLLYQPPLSETGKARLNIMRDTNDGFRIAEEDLKIRGPGEILGTKQTGGLQFRIADLKRDSQWIPTAQYWAKNLVAQDAKIVELLQARWVGHKIDYQHA